MSVSESALRISIEHLLEGVQIIALDWTYLYVNQTAARHGKRSTDELMGRTMMACYPGIDETDLFSVLRRVMYTRRSERMISEFAFTGGEARVFELLIEPVPDGICVLSLDITERREAELQLQQAQKMEAIGQLAGGVAHDFNNMLTAILGYAELLSAQIGPDKPLGRDLQEIVLAAQRAAALTKQLLAFSRKQRLDPVSVSLNAIVTRVEPMLRRLIGENITIRTELDLNTAPVLADPTQLEQVLLNLAVNARDAMPDGGTLTLETRKAPLEEDDLREPLEARPGPHAVLSVVDTGVGMPPEVRRRIFEPFFTTKDGGRGTGLGLAAVHGIVNQLGGHIWVYSEPGQGTVFKIYLPTTDQPVESVVARTPRGAAVGSERILLVEDEPAVRAFARTVLERHGYWVWDVESAEAALAWIGAGGDVVDLVVSDVRLPGLTGVDLAARIVRDHAPVRVLLMSGYAEPISGAVSPRPALLEKPFTAHALLAHVRTVLSAGTP